MTRCSVRGCKTNRKSNNLTHTEDDGRLPTLFAVPKSPTLLAKWKAALHQDLSPKARVCELHFAHEDVKRSDDTILPDGSVFQLPRVKFGLEKNAVPVDLANRENNAPELEMETEETTSSETGKTDTVLNDHQYYIDAKKPDQYCYYNKRVAACFTIPSLHDDVKKLKKMVTEDNSPKIKQKTVVERDKKLECQMSTSIDELPTLVHTEQSALSTESIIDHLQRNPIRRLWTWMKFTSKDEGITFIQIHYRTKKVRCYIELYEDFSLVIQTGDEQISLEVEFEITTMEHITDLLATVEKMEICGGTGFDSESRDKNCTGLILPEEKIKLEKFRDRCVVCRALRRRVRIRQNYGKLELTEKYQKVKKELDLLKRRCKYYESRLTMKNKRLKNIKEMIKSYNKNQSKSA